MYELLGGMRVVECASFIAAPSCALHLQQLGAEVIRIDPVGGGPDFNRWPIASNGASLYWEGLNKGKKSVAIDLRSPQGRELAQEIITAPGANSGIFVTNFPRVGFLAHEALKKRREDLITVRVEGWSDGESAVDYTVNASLGIPYMTGGAENGEAPVNHVLPAWDLLTGAYAAFSVLAAERHRRDTGEGQEVLLPLSDIAMASLGHMGQIAEVLQQGDRPRMGNDLFGAFGRDFITSDGRRIMVVAITSRQWQGLLKALQLEHAVGEVEATLGVSFGAHEGVRFEHRHRLFPLFEQAIRQRSLVELQTLFSEHHVCWAPYRTLSEGMAEDPRLALSTPLFTQGLSHPSGHTYPAPGAAATFTGAERQPVKAAPPLGHDTEQVLSEVLGLSSGKLAALHDLGTIRLS